MHAKSLGENKTLQTSREITDAQQGIHKNLEAVVKKHFQHRYKKPIAKHTLEAFNAIKQRVEDHLKQGRPLIFDSCCGTAMSTGIIATQNPDALVIGIDRSAVRLSKEYNNDLPENTLLVQAECADFWSLAERQGWTLQHHYILYPNPYPKSKHLKRRWHGHPAFPLLFALGGQLQLRTNWKVYADEFCRGLELGIIELGIIETTLKTTQQPSVECINDSIKDEPALTLFEKKYLESSQLIYQCKSTL